MFLGKDNSIKWKWLMLAAAFTVAFCVAGVLWFDKPLFEFLRNFDWRIWGIFDAVFATKVWLFASFVAAMLICIKNKIKPESNKDKNTNKFNFKQFLVNFIQKSKDNYGILIFCSVLFASVAGGVLKYVLGRARPVFYEMLGHTGFYPFNSEWAFNSMPSGHATASFAGLVMLGLLFPKVKWATWTLAVIIGVSRISYGAHWPTDIILGAFIGMASADLVYSWCIRRIGR